MFTVTLVMVFLFINRAYEQDIHKKQEKELKDLEAAHMRETQSMLTDFDKAQELLKEKISVLEHLYVYITFCNYGFASR